MVKKKAGASQQRLKAERRAKVGLVMPPYKKVDISKTSKNTKQSAYSHL